jgi:predicted MFS family arabinose efflux permease
MCAATGLALVRSASTVTNSTTPIYWLALGTFAIGTEGFMIAPLLPGMAADLRVSVWAVGQLVTVFALAYAISSPILTALTGSIDRRKLLMLSMTAFALANVVAWAARDYWWVMGARTLLALAAGLYVPNANALAGALVAPERRGRALAIVNGGTTVAVAFGVPLGAAIGDRLGWRATFASVGVMAALATAGLSFGLHRRVGRVMSVVSLRERFAVAQRPEVLLALLVTTLWATGAYTVYTYIALLVNSATGLKGPGISAVLFLWGVSAAAGVFTGGYLNDRLGSRSVMIPALVALALAFASLSATAALLPPRSAIVPVLGAIVVWGIAAWSFFPSQQARLIEIAGPAVAPIVLSLNASFMFTGFSAGAALGSLTVACSSVAYLGWVGAACEVAALLFLVATTRNSTAVSVKA